MRRAASGLVVRRNDVPFRVVAAVGADLWVVAEGPGPVDRLRLRPAGDAGLWVATDDREPRWVLHRRWEASE